MTLLLGPGGSAKSDWVAERFLKEGERSLLIVASMPQAQTRSAEIGVKAGREPSEFQGRILPFHALVTLLTPASSQNESHISRAFQRMILAEVVRTNIRPDDFFGAMLEAPGFVNALSERVREWKLAGITPELLAAGSSDAAKLLQAPSFLLKTTELVRLFQAYQDFLKTHLLQDDEDILISSAERLLSDHAKIPAEANVILFDSFYRFTKAQRNLISALSTRLVLNGEGRSEVVVTLPVEASRPLLYAAPINTLEKFQNEFAVNEVVLPGQSREKPAILNFLSDHLFSPVRETPPHSLLSANSTPALQMIDAPNSYVEAELIAREFVRLHATKEYPWGDFAVILRTMGDYTPILSAVFERYQIPLGVDGPERLLDNPLLRTGHLMLQVFRFGWRRDDVIAFLKSSYIASNKLEVDQLRLRARAKAVRSGKDNWLNMVGIAGGEVEALIAEFSVRAEKSNLNFQIALLASLDSRFRSECRTPSDFVEGMKEALAEFEVEEKSKRGDATTRERDAQALKEGLEVLNALAQMARIGGRETMSFEEFYTEISREWSAAVTRAMPVTLILKRRAHSSSVASSTDPTAPTPALLARISMTPTSAWTTATALLTL